jgi:ribosome-associated protein
VFTDFFVITHGTSSRHVSTIAEAIEEKLGQDFGRKPNHVEGKRVGEWILLDYIDFVVHVFTADRRAFFGLERLWGDAPRLEIQAGGAPPAAPKASARPRRRRAGSE